MCSQEKLIKPVIWYSDWLNFKDGWKLNHGSHDCFWENLNSWHMRWGHLRECLYRFWLLKLVWNLRVRTRGFPALFQASTLEYWLGVEGNCWRGSWSASTKTTLWPYLFLFHQHPTIAVTSLSLAKIITLCFTCCELILFSMGPINPVWYFLSQSISFSGVPT